MTADREQRCGITIPFDDRPLPEQRDRIIRAEQLGYRDLWSAESNGADAFTPLATAAAWTSDVRLATGIVSPFTRGPAVLAQTAASMEELAPGRFALGIGTSTPPIVEGWNAAAFDRPLQRTRDTLRFLREALAGGRVDAEYETFAIKGFQLGRPPQSPPPLILAALRPGMLRLAAEEADGAITNWLSAADVERVRAVLGPDPELVARLFVCPTEDTDTVRTQARRNVAAYLNVPAYRKFHEWLGREEELAEMWAAWQANDRKAALRAIPDQVVDDIFIHGTTAECRAHIQRYFDSGVDSATLFIFPWGGVDIDETLEALAPSPA
jgi:probable F420-dependent oxidoreductase